MRSRRLIGGLTIAMTLVSGVPADAYARLSDPKERVVEGTYVSPVIGGSVRPARTSLFYFDCTQGVGCAHFSPQGNEKFARVEIVDTVPVENAMIFIRDFSGTDILWACGGETPVFPVYGEVLVMVVSGVCEDASPSAPTTGTIRITFSGRAKNPR